MTNEEIKKVIATMPKIRVEIEIPEDGCKCKQAEVEE